MGLDHLPKVCPITRRQITSSLLANYKADVYSRPYSTTSQRERMGWLTALNAPSPSDRGKEWGKSYHDLGLIRLLRQPLRPVQKSFSKCAISAV
jgi:hypothetical protein